MPEQKAQAVRSGGARGCSGRWAIATGGCRLVLCVTRLAATSTAPLRSASSRPPALTSARPSVASAPALGPHSSALSANKPSSLFLSASPHFNSLPNFPTLSYSPMTHGEEKVFSEDDGICANGSPRDQSRTGSNIKLHLRNFC